MACGPAFRALLFALHEQLLGRGTRSADGPPAADSSVGLGGCRESPGPRLPMEWHSSSGAEKR